MTTENIKNFQMYLQSLDGPLRRDKSAKQWSQFTEPSDIATAKTRLDRYAKRSAFARFFWWVFSSIRAVRRRVLRYEAWVAKKQLEIILANVDRIDIALLKSTLQATILQLKKNIKTAVRGEIVRRELTRIVAQLQAYANQIQIVPTPATAPTSPRREDWLPVAGVLPQPNVGLKAADPIIPPVVVASASASEAASDLSAEKSELPGESVAARAEQQRQVDLRERIKSVATKALNDLILFKDKWGKEIYFKSDEKEDYKKEISLWRKSNFQFFLFTHENWLVRNNASPETAAFAQEQFKSITGEVIALKSQVLGGMASDEKDLDEVEFERRVTEQAAQLRDIGDKVATIEKVMQQNLSDMAQLKADFATVYTALGIPIVDGKPVFPEGFSVPIAAETHSSVGGDGDKETSKMLPYATESPLPPADVCAIPDTHKGEVTVLQPSRAWPSAIGENWASHFAAPPSADGSDGEDKKNLGCD